MSINLKQRYEQRRLVELRETLEIADFDYLVERHDILTEKLDASEKKNIIKLFNAANKIDFPSFKSAVEIAKKKIGRVISGKFFSSKGNVEKFADLFTGFIQALREVVDTAATVLGEEIDSNNKNTIFDIIGSNDLKDSLIQLLNDSIERSARKAFNLNVKSLAMEIMQKSPADITELSGELTGRKEKSSSSSSLESGRKGESKGEEDKGGGGKGGGDEEGKAGGGGGLKFMINDIAVETGKSKKIVKKVIKTLFKLGAIKENKAFSISRLLMERGTQQISRNDNADNPGEQSAEIKEQIKSQLKKMNEENIKQLYNLIEEELKKTYKSINAGSFVGTLLRDIRNNWKQVGERQLLDAIINSMIKTGVTIDSSGTPKKSGVGRTIIDTNTNEPAHGPGQTVVPGENQDRKTVAEEPSPEALGGASSGSGGGGGNYNGMISWLKNFPDLLEKAAEEADSHPKKFISNIEAGIEKLRINNPNFLKNLGDRYQKFEARLKKLSTAVSNETGFKQDIVDDIMRQIPANKIKVNESVSTTKGMSLRNRYLLRNH